MSTAEQQRRWRANRAIKEGRTPGVPGRPYKELMPCGTPAAYKRHQRNNETPDEACREAWAAYQREMYAKRKGKK